jgi:hypothetical protein
VLKNAIFGENSSRSSSIWIEKRRLAGLCEMDTLVSSRRESITWDKNLMVSNCRQLRHVYGCGCSLRSQSVMQFKWNAWPHEAVAPSFVDEIDSRQIAHSGDASDWPSTDVSGVALEVSGNVAELSAVVPELFGVGLELPAFSGVVPEVSIVLEIRGL